MTKAQGIPHDTAAQLLGIPPASLSALVRDGHVRQIDTNAYAIPTLVQDYIAWLEGQHHRGQRHPTQREVGEHLTASHSFGDAALLRRQLCDAGLMARTPDCREYRRVEGRPAPLGLALIAQLRRVGTLPVAGQTA